MSINCLNEKLNYLKRMRDNNVYDAKDKTTKIDDMKDIDFQTLLFLPFHKNDDEENYLKLRDEFIKHFYKKNFQVDKINTENNVYYSIIIAICNYFNIDLPVIYESVPPISNVLHTNVEIVSSSRSISYLQKYISEPFDFFDIELEYNSPIKNIKDELHKLFNYLKNNLNLTYFLNVHYKPIFDILKNSNSENIYPKIRFLTLHMAMIEYIFQNYTFKIVEHTSRRECKASSFAYKHFKFDNEMTLSKEKPHQKQQSYNHYDDSDQTRKMKRTYSGVDDSDQTRKMKRTYRGIDDSDQEDESDKENKHKKMKRTSTRTYINVYDSDQENKNRKLKRTYSGVNDADQEDESDKENIKKMKRTHNDLDRKDNGKKMKLTYTNISDSEDGYYSDNNHIYHNSNSFNLRCGKNNLQHCNDYYQDY